MISSWFSSSTIYISPTHKVNFENVQTAIQNPSKYCLINTLSREEQDCLIKGTLSVEQEENVINEMLTQSNVPDKIVIVYGKNTNDIMLEKKYKQLRDLGCMDVFVYFGGLFEWLLLGDVFGEEEFPIFRSPYLHKTKIPLDLLKFKPVKIS